jgi:hypothetical protein
MRAVLFKTWVAFSASYIIFFISMPGADENIMASANYEQENEIVNCSDSINFMLNSHNYIVQIQPSILWTAGSKTSSSFETASKGSTISGFFKKLKRLLSGISKPF